MLNRDSIKEFLLQNLEDYEIEIPEEIDFDLLVDAFCKFVENDYYEWLNDNFKSFFCNGIDDWSWIKDKMWDVIIEKIDNFNNEE